MFSITIKGFNTREEVLQFLGGISSIEAEDNFHFIIKSEEFKKEKSVFGVNLNKKNFDLEIESV
jgi:hypothetical protein